MKNYPSQLRTLLEEPAVPSRFKTPESLQKIILEFQTEHQLAEGGHKLTIPEITVLAIKYGIKQIEKDIEKLKSKSHKNRQK